MGTGGGEAGARFRDGAELEVDVLDAVAGVEVRRCLGVAEDDRAAPCERVPVISKGGAILGNIRLRQMKDRETYRSLASHTTEWRSFGTMSAVIRRSTPGAPSMTLAFAGAFTLRGGVRILSLAHSCIASSTIPPMNVRPGGRRSTLYGIPG